MTQKNKAQQHENIYHIKKESNNIQAFFDFKP